MNVIPAACWSIAGLVCDLLGALILVWPVLQPGRRGFDTMDYVQSWKTRGGAVLLLLGFVLQAVGAYLSGGQR